MHINKETIIAYLEDEGLGPYKIKQHGDKFEIKINEPSQWGTGDKKMRCSIGVKEIDSVDTVVFNAFKAKAMLGDEYSGSWFAFVKLTKDFSSIYHAKHYFFEKYLMHTLSNEQIKNIYHADEKSETEKEHAIWLPTHLEKLNKKHTEYYDYLINRGVSEQRIKNTKIFVNTKDKRLVFPVYENNKLIFYTQRDITNLNLYRWIKSEGENIHPVWNLENILGNTVIIFEGIFDAIPFPNGIALLGVGTEEQMNKILRRHFSKIILVFDNDVEGRKAKIKWAEWLFAKGHDNIYVYNYHDIDEKDMGSMFENETPHDIHERSVKWTLQTQALIKLKRIL